MEETEQSAEAFRQTMRNMGRKGGMATARKHDYRYFRALDRRAGLASAAARRARATAQPEMWSEGGAPIVTPPENLVAGLQTHAHATPSTMEPESGNVVPMAVELPPAHVERTMRAYRELFARRRI